MLTTDLILLINQKTDMFSVPGPSASFFKHKHDFLKCII